MKKIQTVCVIGSGVMGSGIAAQVANSETNVILLDIAYIAKPLPEHSEGSSSKSRALSRQGVEPLQLEPELNELDPQLSSGSHNIRNKIVQNAYDKLFTTKPPPLSHPVCAKYIKLGNLKDDIALIKEADLIIEVIVEKLEIKHQLYENIRSYLKPTAVLASNTSTLPLARLKEKLPTNIKSRFIITHFFNPPRYMELVELITSSETDKTIIPRISDFLRVKLGKTIVECNDTPGFIANRVGCFLLELVVRGAIKEGLAPQKIDHIFSSELGFPSTGIFGLYDLIGHDVMDLISESLLKSLPKDDKYHEIYTKSPVLDEMRAAGLIGRKAGAGFYKIVKDESGKSVKQVIDWEGLNYSVAPNRHPEEPEGRRGDPMTPEIATSVALQPPRNDIDSFISKTLQTFFYYVQSLIPSVTTKKEDIDKAMKLGYSLKYGPFELMERLGKGVTVNPEQSTRHPSLREGPSPKSRALSPQVTEPLQLEPELKELDPSFRSGSSSIILSNDSAYLRKANNHYIFAMNTKMNVLDTEVFNLMIQAVHYLEQKNKPMYIFPDGNNFSAGADLTYLKELIESKNYKLIEKYLELGQRAMLCLKYAKIPVIACARGVALGGGAEILLHAHHVVAHQNLTAGLVELSVGLIPAFGGTKEMFLRCGGDKTKLVQNLRNILTQNKSSSADYFAQEYNAPCSVSMHKDLLLERGLEWGERKRSVKNRHPEEPEGRRGDLVPQEIAASVAMQPPRNDVFFSFNDLTFAIPSPDALQLDIINFFQTIIDKKTVSEQQLLDLEREKFLRLASKPLALERIKSIMSR